MLLGNYPFTTIKPNHGVSYVPVDCPCKKYGKQDLCRPRYGKVNCDKFRKEEYMIINQDDINIS